MKKNFIYTVVFLLCGAISFSSCEDMLNVESERVEYEFDGWNFNDSVFSVLGILKSVQNIGDRHILLNELRADLVSPNSAKAVPEIAQLCNLDYNLETNEYLDVKDYYSIINNCNIFLARVDTTLEKDHVKLMLPEYVAVKSIRTWTYLQLCINHGSIPYFTEPILTHDDATEVMSKPMLSREQLMTKLIDEMLPYENPHAYPMPSWDKSGKVLNIGTGIKEIASEFNEAFADVPTKNLFVPVRMLLGELYLWRGAAGDYKRAAECFYNQITGANTSKTARQYNDYSYRVKYGNESKGERPISDKYSSRFAQYEYSKVLENSVLTLIPYCYSDIYGSTSNLASVFSPLEGNGAAQVVASPSMLSLSRRQVYRHYEGSDPKAPDKVEYSINFDYPGDLRIKATTYSQIGNDEAKTKYENIIAKFNLYMSNVANMQVYDPVLPVMNIVLLRPEHAYLRFAEAMMGLEREGYVGAMDVAMEVLKVGVKKKYNVVKNPKYEQVAGSNPAGGTTENKVLASYDDLIEYDFTESAFDENLGIHSRGCGDSERNEYYALNDICVARHLGMLEKQGGVDVVNGTLTHEDSVNYVTDLIIDELALELAWEGTRYGDLMRFSLAMGDNEIIAKRIAGRDCNNSVSNRHPEYEYDGAIYSKLMDENNWYLPLPDGVVQPIEDGKKQSGGNK